MITSTSKIAIIGVGLMGHGIALNVCKAGFELRFLSHPGNQPVSDLIEMGAVAVDHVKDLGAWADVTILCVTGSPQVEDVLYDKGLLDVLDATSIVIDCSTAIPSSTHRIAQDVQAKGAQFMDAPMTRTPNEAAQGRLNLLVGASPELFDACQPLLQTFAENIWHAGPVGSGHQLKLIHNFVSLGFGALMSEAVACAKISGIEMPVLLDVLAKGGGGGVVLERLKPYIEAQDPSGFNFAMSNALKDITYYCTMSGEAGARGDIALGVKNAYASAAQTNPDAKVPELIDILVRAGGQANHG